MMWTRGDQRTWRSRAAAYGSAVVALATAVSCSGATAPAAFAGRPGSTVPKCAPGVGFLGFSDALNKDEYAGTDVGGLSDLVYDRKRDRYYAVVDNQGDTPARFYTVHMPVAGADPGDPSIRQVTYLHGSSGAPLTGTNFDGEGMAMTRAGHLFVSSETEPSIRRFSNEGRLLATLPVPEKFLIDEGRAKGNRTFESLALSPNEHSLFTAVEAPLEGDGRTEDGRGRIRILRYDDRGLGGFRPADEYFYRTAPGEYVVEIAALSEDELLVLERSYTPGQGNTIRIFRVSLDDAADVSDEPTLAANALAPVDKSLLVDVANCPPSGAETPGTQANPLLDNFEGMALGPRLPGGRRALLLISDDNFNDVQVTRIVALAVQLHP